MSETVDIVDEYGRKRRFLVDDPEDAELAAEIGIDIGVPDLVNGIDWQAIAVELSNKLFDRGIFTPDDVRNNDGVISNVARGVVGKAIINLYDGV